MITLGFSLVSHESPVGSLMPELPPAPSYFGRNNNWWAPAFWSFQQSVGDIAMTDPSKSSPNFWSALITYNARLPGEMVRSHHPGKKPSSASCEFLRAEQLLRCSDRCQNIMGRGPCCGTGPQRPLSLPVCRTQSQTTAWNMATFRLTDQKDKQGLNNDHKWRWGGGRMWILDNLTHLCNYYCWDVIKIP